MNHLYSPTTTKFAIRFGLLFSNSSITFRFLLLTRGSSTVRLPTDSANFSPWLTGFFFFGVVPVCLRDVVQCWSHGVNAGHRPHPWPELRAQHRQGWACRKRSHSHSP
jgi:hypothetical protein